MHSGSFVQEHCGGSTTLVEGSHTFQKLAFAMQQVYQACGGIKEKVKTVITNNAENVKAAVEL